MNKGKFKNKRVVWMFRLLFLSMLFGMFSSCASFSNIVKNPARLNSNNVHLLNGMYSIASLQSDSLEKVRGEKDWYHRNFLQEIDRKLIKDTLAIDTTSSYAFRLQMKNPKLLHIDYIKNDTIFRERKLKTKISKAGYLKLKNKNLQLLLVPYVFGAIDVKRTRITIDAAQNLIFDVGKHRSGGALLLIIDGRKYQYRNRYRRISANTKTVNQ